MIGLLVDDGWIVYLLLLALLWLFWSRVRGLDTDGLLERDARLHERVHRVLGRHPEGGTWPEFRAWMRAAEEGKGP